jgi:hypothetical protein
MTDEFAIRTFFWWGNFCSITLQLKGKYQALFNAESFVLNSTDWFICTNTDEWQHHFRQDNYQPLATFPIQQIQQLPFIKLAKKIPLEKWDNMEVFCVHTFSEIMKAVSLTT